MPLKMGTIWGKATYGTPAGYGTRHMELAGRSLFGVQQAIMEWRMQPEVKIRGRSLKMQEPEVGAPTWRYIHDACGQQAGCCPEGDVRQRAVQPQDPLG